MNIELFPCSGGFAEGFRRAGITFDLAIEKDPDHCESYARNHSHRPRQQDVHDFAAEVRAGVYEAAAVDLIVADPPCTPWSRAGKRRGTADPRDCLAVTAELVALLRPRAALIGNVPGLQDSTSWGTVQRVIGGLARDGYCIDYTSIDAADVGVPQHRVRPFWFLHLTGTPCIRWPARTHASPEEAARAVLPGMPRLRPWVVCREAFAHIPIDKLGRKVTLRSKFGPGSDGERARDVNRPPTRMNAPHRTITTQSAFTALIPIDTLTANAKHPVNVMDEPSMTVTAKGNMQGAQGACALQLDGDRAWRPSRKKARVPQSERVSSADAPAPVVQAREDRIGHGLTLVLFEPPPPPKRPPSTQGNQWSRTHDINGPGPTVMTDTDRATGNNVKLAWPWDRPATTIQGDERLNAPGHHDPKVPNAQHANAVILSERAAAILQGFPERVVCGCTPAPTEPWEVNATPETTGETCATCGQARALKRWTFYGKTKKARWSAIGQAMPPPLAQAVATAIVLQMNVVQKG